MIRRICDISVKDTQEQEYFFEAWGADGGIFNFETNIRPLAVKDRARREVHRKLRWILREKTRRIHPDWEDRPNSFAIRIGDVALGIWGPRTLNGVAIIRAITIETGLGSSKRFDKTLSLAHRQRSAA